MAGYPVRGRIVAMAIQVALVAGAMTAARSDVFARYLGEGEAVARVLESHVDGVTTVFDVEIESQNVKGPKLGSGGRFLYSGSMMEKIRPGSRVHLWFSGGADIWCDPCGIFVTQIKFDDGTVGNADLVEEGKATHTTIPGSHSYGPEFYDRWLTILSVLVAFAVAAAVFNIKRFRFRRQY